MLGFPPVKTFYWLERAFYLSAMVGLLVSCLYERKAGNRLEFERNVAMRYAEQVDKTALQSTDCAVALAEARVYGTMCDFYRQMSCSELKEVRPSKVLIDFDE